MNNGRISIAKWWKMNEIGSLHALERLEANKRKLTGDVPKLDACVVSIRSTACILVLYYFNELDQHGRRGY